MNWSEFGHKLTARSGILELMDDLGNAMQRPGEKYMLGGGNPAGIAEVQKAWRRRMEEILANGDEFERAMGNYDTPQGKDDFLQAMARLLNREYGWDIKAENIAVTNGSQNAFFILFNLLSGSSPEGYKRIMIPLNPEYIGYADQGISEDHFVTQRPNIELIGKHEFKYHVDFSSLTVKDDIAAICVSRPTNPTGNVLTDEEIIHLNNIAQNNDIPLMIDNAYGAPFPNIIFSNTKPIWNPNIILGLSLSKLGLPSTRTGILVARPEVVKAVSAINAITSLANGTLGQIITAPIMESGELLQLCRETITPYYLGRSQHARQAMQLHFEGLPWRVHKSEGAMFLWIWFDHPQIDTFKLYEQLKKRNVIVVPGKYFFFGLDNKTRKEDYWEHRNQCIRINFGGDPDITEKAIQIIADEAKNMIACHTID